MTNNQKDTVYIDVDDEITAVIDKLRGSPHKIVALVLPKRAAVFQSIVNMKLLKRAGEQTKKKIVLITSEEALLPLAGVAGLYVAKTLQSKPEIPPVPSATDKPDANMGEAPLDPNAPVGQLAGEKEASIPVDESPDKPAKKPEEKAKPAKGDKKPKVKVPNFEKFRKRIILGVIALVILIVGFVLAFVVLPKATITLSTDTSNLDTNLSFIADTGAQAFDKENSLLPAISKEFRRTDTEQVDASGENNKGKKASGSVVLTNCSESTGSVTIPSGTSVSSGNLTYVTTSSVSLPESSFNSDDECKTASKTVSVTAEQPGTAYNISSGKNFSVAGYNGVKATNNSAMKGGTDDIVKVVTQADIDKATNAIQQRANGTAASDLEEDLREEGYYPIKETLVAGEPTVTADHNAGDEANSVTVTSTTVNTMLGVKEGDLDKLIEADVNQQIDTSTQAINDNGLNDATFSVQNVQNSQTTISLQATVVAGPKLDSDAIKKEIAGKGKDDIEQTLKGRPDISEVDVSFSPFWVGSAPKDINKITLKFEDDKNGND